MTKTARYLDSTLYYGFQVFVVLLFLILSPSTSNQFELPKFIILQAGTILLLTFFLVSLLVQGGEIRRTSLDLPVLVFLGLATIAALLSVHTPTSLFGKYNRYEGLLTLIAYGVLFFLSVQIFHNPSRLWPFARTVVITAVFISIYGLLQYKKIDLFSWNITGSSFSTFGNPTFLGGFLVTILPLTLALFFLQKKSSQLLLYALSILLITCCLFTTNSRGAWLAALLGLFLFGLVTRRKLLTWRKHLLVLSVCFVSLALLIGTLFPESPIQMAAFRDPVRSFLKIEERSFAVRMEIWKSAARAIAARPVFGFGPDTFRLAFSNYQTVRYVRLSGWQAIADNAHSYPMQLGATLGISGLLSFLTIIFIFLWKALSLIHKSGEDSDYLLLCGFVIGAAAHLIHLLSQINMIASTAFLWIIFGIVSTQLLKKKEIKIYWGNMSAIRAVLVLLIIAPAFLGMELSLRPYRADVHYTRAKNLAGYGYSAQAIREFEMAINLNPYFSRYKAELGLIYLDLWQSKKDRRALNTSIQIFEWAKGSDPLEVDNYMALANAFIAGGEEYPEYYDRAIKVLKHVLKLKVHSSLTHYTLGRAYFLRGEPRKALNHLQTAIDLDPKFDLVYPLLIECYQQVGDPARAKEAQKAYETLSK